MKKINDDCRYEKVAKKEEMNEDVGKKETSQWHKF
jgi:hypothetical protein